MFSSKKSYKSNCTNAFKMVWIVAIWMHTRPISQDTLCAHSYHDATYNLCAQENKRRIFSFYPILNKMKGNVFTRWNHEHNNPNHWNMLFQIDIYQIVNTNKSLYNIFYLRNRIWIFGRPRTWVWSVFELFCFIII